MALGLALSCVGLILLGLFHGGELIAIKNIYLVHSIVETSGCNPRTHSLAGFTNLGEPGSVGGPRCWTSFFLVHRSVSGGRVR